MNYTGYELLWLFLAYSFLGWILETVYAAVKQKKFVNRGLINGPFCIIYGTAAVLMTIGLHEATGIWLFIGSILYATVIEWSAGHLIEKYYHERWWDYSNFRWNLEGYICLPMSLIWGVAGCLAVRWGNPLLTRLYFIFPWIIRDLMLWILLAVLIIDALATYLLLNGKSKHPERWQEADNWFISHTARLNNWIALHVEKRIHIAYQEPAKIEPEETTGAFAEGCGFYKVVMLFFIGAFLGDITETIFCRITAGIWMSRSSVVWGPFSIVWGLAIALVTALLYRYRNYPGWILFSTGTFLGGAYEYFCSMFTELVFGTVFWDYSEIPFNLGGRINLIYCFYWGIAAVVWFKCLYPFISKVIEKLPVLFGKLLTWGLLIFMCCNITVSCMALLRYNERQQNAAAAESWQVWMDEHYDDTRMEQIYPNAIAVE